VFRKPDGTLRVDRVLGGILAAWLTIWVLWFVIDWVSSRATPQAGQIGVVRSGADAVWIGSWFNGHGIHSVVTPGSGSTYVGLGSTVHWYPSDSVQRNYTITSDPSRGDRPGVDFVEVPTADGVQVRLEGTFYFTTDFNASPTGEKAVRGFDSQFGVRTFPIVGSDCNGTPCQAYPWEGTEGWDAFLDTVVRPIIDNDLRRSIGSVTCAQLVSSCAIVHQGQAVGTASGGQTNQTTIQQIQNQINASLEQDIATTLGQDFFSKPGSSGIQFLLARVALPTVVQNQIDNAQAAYASVAAAKAQVNQNIELAKAKAELQKAYANCPACAVIDELKAIPANVTTFAPGAGFAITPK
jgi:SPFH domain / Band 7 family